MTGRLHYGHTRRACYLGYITQAVVNNLPPLLFLTFQREFHISLEAITMLISMNFGIQLVTDLVFAKVIDRIGYRVSAVLSHVLAFAGLCLLGILPYSMPSPFAGLCLAVGVNAVGGGLAEVLISPIVESLPGDKKSSSMSLLHSFYCWGQVGVILLSTLYFTTIGTEKWRYLPMVWSLIPLFNIFFFAKVPLCRLVEDGAEQIPVRKLFQKKVFWILLCLMVCSGAAEQAMAQWASLFAEAGLRVSKTMGDLLGPCAFAVLMGVSRTFYGIFGHRVHLNRALAVSGLGCVASYLLAVFSPYPLLSLVGCALCGLSVGLMWPGVTSLSAKQFPFGGTAMFAFLALAGDLGCSAGPGLAGAVSGVVSQGALGLSALTGSGDGALRAGLLAVTIFPLVMLGGLWLLRKRKESAIS